MGHPALDVAGRMMIERVERLYRETCAFEKPPREKDLDRLTARAEEASEGVNIYLGLLMKEYIHGA